MITTFIVKKSHYRKNPLLMKRLFCFIVFAGLFSPPVGENETQPESSSDSSTTPLEMIHPLALIGIFLYTKGCKQSYAAASRIPLTNLV
jgi:hypothetical protein